MNYIDGSNQWSIQPLNKHNIFALIDRGREKELIRYKDKTLPWRHQLEMK